MIERRLPRILFIVILGSLIAISCQKSNHDLLAKITNQEKRLLELEKKVYLLVKNAGGSAGLSDSITAREFVIVDQNGKRRGMLGLDEKGLPGLRLENIGGECRMGLWLLENGLPGLAFFDHINLRLALTITDKGMMTFVLSGNNNKPSIGLEVDKKGEPNFRLLDANGKTRIALAIINGEAPGIGLYDEKGELRVCVGIEKDGPRIFVSDVGGRTIWSAP